MVKLFYLDYQFRLIPLFFCLFVSQYWPLKTDNTHFTFLAVQIFANILVSYNQSCLKNLLQTLRHPKDTLCKEFKSIWYYNSFFQSARQTQTLKVTLSPRYFMFLEKHFSFICLWAKIHQTAWENLIKTICVS